MNSTISPSEKIDFLYVHYQESYKLSTECKNRRNKFFVILCVLEAVNALVSIKPAAIFSLLMKVVNAKLETTIQLGNSIIQTFLWVLIAYVTIRYVQETLQIERQYKYLDRLEKRIREVTGEMIFDREGDDYQCNYPIVLNLIDLFYKMVCPILFVAINIVNIVKEWEAEQTFALELAVDTIFCISIVLITWFYFFEIHDKIANFFKKCSLINKLSIKLHDILRMV